MKKKATLPGYFAKICMRHALTLRESIKHKWRMRRNEKENSEKKNNTSEKKISAEQTETEQKSDKTEQLPDVKTEKADKTEQIYQQEADERKAQKRVREAVQKENSEAAGKAHESYVIQPGDTLFQISMDRYGSIEAISQICKLNGMSADEIIYPGQVIVLP